jgi:hypothetical protein
MADIVLEWQVFDIDYVRKHRTLTVAARSKHRRVPALYSPSPDVAREGERAIMGERQI